MSFLGKRGRGPSKARSTKQARKAAKASWKNRKAAKRKEAA